MQIQCYSCEKFNDVLSYTMVNSKTGNYLVIDTCKKCRTKQQPAYQHTQPKKIKGFSPLNPESQKHTRFLRFLHKILTN